MRTFARVYYATLALTLAGSICLPWLVPISLRALGFDPQLTHADTVAAAQAYAATASLRRGFVAGVLLLAMGVVALSVAGLLLGAPRRTDIPKALLALAAFAATSVAVIAAIALLAGGSGMCC